MSTENKIVIKVVENMEELLKAYVVRAIVYMHEQDCPYSEEFDLNDFTSTQIIGMIDGEPVLTARIRYFGDFAKLERLAVRGKFRGEGFGHDLLRFMMDLCQRKGYTRLYLHAQERLTPFYKSYGFKPVGRKFGFSDHEYVEMLLNVSCKSNSDTLKFDPLVLNRPEGRMDVPGPIEASLARMSPVRVVK
jgi:predicted GNAT family N-acyltransferase